MKLKRKFAQKLRASIELNQMRKCVKRAWSVPFFNALTMSRFADFATEDYEGEILKMGDNVNIHPLEDIEKIIKDSDGQKKAKTPHMFKMHQSIHV